MTDFKLTKAHLNALVEDHELLDDELDSPSSEKITHRLRGTEYGQGKKLNKPPRFDKQRYSE